MPIENLPDFPTDEMKQIYVQKEKMYKDYKNTDQTFQRKDILWPLHITTSYSNFSRQWEIYIQKLARKFYDQFIRTAEAYQKTGQPLRMGEWEYLKEYATTTGIQVWNGEDDEFATTVWKHVGPFAEIQKLRDSPAKKKFVYFFHTNQDFFDEQKQLQEVDAGTAAAARSLIKFHKQRTQEPRDPSVTDAAEILTGMRNVQGVSVICDIVNVLHQKLCFLELTSSRQLHSM